MRELDREKVVSEVDYMGEMCMMSSVEGVSQIKASPKKGFPNYRLNI